MQRTTSPLSARDRDRLADEVAQLAALRSGSLRERGASRVPLSRCLFGYPTPAEVIGAMKEAEVAELKADSRRLDAENVKLYEEFGKMRAAKDA